MEGTSHLKEKITLTCGDCGVGLIKLINYDTEDSDKKQRAKYRVSTCYNCGGSSFYTKTLDGKVALSPVSEKIFFDVEDQIVGSDGILSFDIKTARR